MSAARPRLRSAITPALMSASLDMVARDISFYVEADTFSRTYQAAGTSKATSLVDATLTTLAHIGEGAQITAPDLISIISRQDNVQSNTTANTKIAGGLTGSLTSIADNDLAANSNVTTETGSLLQTRELYVEASTPTVRGGYVRTADTDAATVVNYIWDVVGETCKTVWTIITFGLWDGKEVCEPVMGWVRQVTNSDENGITRGSENRNSTILFNSEVVLQGPDNPVLEINEKGNVITAEGFTINDTDGETLGPVRSDSIVVNDIFNDAVGKLSIIAPTGSISGDAIFNFRETFENTLIVNNSDKDLVLGNIEVWNKNKSGQNINIQVAEQNDFARDRAGNGYQLITSFADSTVDIINNGSGDIILTGVIDNPGGTTSLYNEGGDIYSPSGELRTRSITIETHSGSIGSAAAPVGIQLLQGEGLSTDFTLRAAQDLYASISGVVNNDAPFVSRGIEVTAGGIAQVNFIDGSRQSLEGAYASVTLTADAADLLVDLNPGASGDSHSFSIGDGFDPSASVVVFDPVNVLSDESIVFDPTVLVDNTISFTAPHGFSTGQAVRYTTDGGGAIDGLVDGGTYYVVADSETTLQLAATRADALAETPVVLALDGDLATGSAHRLNSRQNLVFDVPHSFTTGQAIVYSAGGGTGIGGLVDGGTYYVVVVDATTVKLAQTRADAEAETPLALVLDGTVATGSDHSLNSLDVLELGRVHGFTDGQAVVYRNGGGGNADIGNLVDGQTYYAVVVDATSIQLAASAVDVAAGKVLNLDFGAATGVGHRVDALFDPATAVDIDADSIDVGFAHGLETGDAIVYLSGGGEAIGGLVDGNTYYAVVIDYTHIKLAASAPDALAAAAEIEIAFQRVDFGTAALPVVTVTQAPDGVQLITVQLNTNPGNESTAQELVDAINASSEAGALITAQLDGDGSVEVASNISVDTGERGRVLTGRGEPQVLEFFDSNLIDSAQTGSYRIESGGNGAGELVITGSTNDIILAGLVDFNSISISTAGDILGDDSAHLLMADTIVLAANGDVGTGDAAIRTDILGGQIDVSARNAIHLTETDGDLRVGEISSLTGVVALTAETAAIVDADNGDGSDITAPGAILLAASGIGEADALETAFDSLEADAGTGGIRIDNTGALTIGGLTPSGGLTADGTIEITTFSPLTVAADIIAGGNITLMATDSAADDDNVVVTNGAYVTSISGDIRILGGDNVRIDAGSVITAFGQVTILADQGDVDEGGGTVVIDGIIVAHASYIIGSDEADTIVITNIVTPTTVLAGDAADIIYVGSNATATSNSGGDVDGIAALLVVDGEEGDDILDVDDSGDAEANTGTLTGEDTHRAGHGQRYTVHRHRVAGYYPGQRRRHLHILSTHVGETRLVTGAGEDTVNVRSISGDTSIDAGVHNDTVNVGSNAPAAGGVIDGNRCPPRHRWRRGNDTLNIDDSADTTDNLGTLTESALYGLGMGGGIDYTGIDVLNLDLGSGDDRINVRGTSAETNLDTAQGDDLIYVSSGANLDALETAPANGDLEALHDAILHGTLDAVTGTLNIEAGAGQNTLGVSDRTYADADKNVLLTATSIQGLATADINYLATGGDFSGQGAWARSADRGLFGRGINIYAGAGGNTIKFMERPAPPRRWLHRLRKPLPVCSAVAGRIGPSWRQQ